MAILPQIDNSIKNVIEPTEVQLPSKTYKINDNVITTKVEEEEPTTIVSDEPIEITGPLGKQEASMDIDGGNSYQEQVTAVAGTTIEGNGEVDVNDVDTTKEHLITPRGNTKQAQYQGYNLFDYFNYPVSTTINDITITNLGDGYFKLHGTATADANFNLCASTSVIQNYLNASSVTHKAYYISGTCTKVSSAATRTVIRLNYNAGSQYMIPLQDLSSSLTITKTLPQTSRTDGWAWQVTIGTGDVFNNFIIRYQLEKGDTAHDFEPYVGRSSSTFTKFSTRNSEYRK